MEIKLSKRLSAAVALIPKSTVVADVGCDHAYLPIYLIKTGIASKVVASDINAGPCERALQNIIKNNLESKITVVQTNGLSGIEKYNPEAIVICGMGGDLIYKIISDSIYTQSNSPLLILQPMTKQPQLRSSLLNAGYNIINEELVEDDRLYEIIVARYDGKIRNWSKTELTVGKRNIQKSSDLLAKHIQKLTDQLNTVINGKTKASLDISNEQEILKELEELKQ